MHRLIIQTQKCEGMESCIGFLELESSQLIMSQEFFDNVKYFKRNIRMLKNETGNCEERLTYQPAQEQGDVSFVDHMTKNFGTPISDAYDDDCSLDILDQTVVIFVLEDQLSIQNFLDLIACYIEDFISLDLKFKNYIPSLVNESDLQFESLEQELSVVKCEDDMLLHEEEQNTYTGCSFPFFGQQRIFLHVFQDPFLVLLEASKKEILRSCLRIVNEYNPSERISFQVELLF